MVKHGIFKAEMGREGSLPEIVFTCFEALVKWL